MKYNGSLKTKQNTWNDQIQLLFSFLSCYQNKSLIWFLSQSKTLIFFALISAFCDFAHAQTKRLISQKMKISNF